MIQGNVSLTILSPGSPGLADLLGIIDNSHAWFPALSATTLCDSDLL